MSRASWYRKKGCQQPVQPAPLPRRKSPRALSQQERDKVIETLLSQRFLDRAPRQIVATLLDEDIYLCSASTIYRILRAEQMTKERRAQARHPQYKKPELLATGPNQVWSWDITKLKGPLKYSYYCLYVIIDIFSRFAVGWMVAERESAELARELILCATLQQGIDPNQLTIHADRGSAMKSKSVAQMLTDLGVEKTHSRPHVSNDNPYSESQFKTLKYCPDFPERFGCVEDARSLCAELFDWYNNHHRHSGIAMLTPAMVHSGEGVARLDARAVVLSLAYQLHPERFVSGVPRPGELPDTVWINPPAVMEADTSVSRAGGGSPPSYPTRVDLPRYNENSLAGG
jgi:putative transposase